MKVRLRYAMGNKTSTITEKCFCKNHHVVAPERKWIQKSVSTVKEMEHASNHSEQ